MTHCENCGKENPNTGEGYTSCCNELVCTGEGKDRFGVPTDWVTSCCWAKAEKLFEAMGKKVPDGSSRL